MIKFSMSIVNDVALAWAQIPNWSVTTTLENVGGNVFVSITTRKRLSPKRYVTLMRSSVSGTRTSPRKAPQVTLVSNLNPRVVRANFVVNIVIFEPVPVTRPKAGLYVVGTPILINIRTAVRIGVYIIGLPVVETNVSRPSPPPLLVFEEGPSKHRLTGTATVPITTETTVIIKFADMELLQTGLRIVNFRNLTAGEFVTNVYIVVLVRACPKNPQ